ncbi:hypothetical protein AALO_G00021540 [Alosa alosa]|uniref:Bcr-Abl oncoprotein oligomerisation domain-containing protein n=1 Tax=Alosa alosa TaxID=278164 RepID=A0AAV6HDN6_9TELE|nr:hypothetical protein AALO_G00021540 [Alosa alosa]
MWEHEEFERHWKKEFPDGEVPRMDIHSVEDIEMELDRCKANLRKLQQALAEEKFKVIFLQTSLTRSKKSYDQNESDVYTMISKPDKAQQKQEQSIEVKDTERPVQPEKDPVINKQGEDPARISSFVRNTPGKPSKPGKPIPPPRKHLSFQKGAPAPAPSPAPTSQVVDGSCISRAEGRSDPSSDHEYEEVGLNQNFVSRNLVNPNARDSQRLNLQKDALRQFRLSNDLDSSDDGRLSPLGIRLAGGSGRSTPDRRSDGYLSSDSGNDVYGIRCDCIIPQK